MTLDPYRITRKGVELLCEAIEKYLDRRIKTPYDFSFLTDAIFEQTNRRVSETTLKRIWGYINDKGKDYLPSRYTLCALADFIGYNDFECFLESQNNTNDRSNSIYQGETITSSTLPCGAIVHIRWSSDRECRIRHISGYRFLVIESCNIKLIKGDLVECTSFTQNAPLYFNKVDKVGEDIMTYVAGSTSGINFELE